MGCKKIFLSKEHKTVGGWIPLLIIITVRSDIENPARQVIGYRQSLISIYEIYSEYSVNIMVLTLDGNSEDIANV